MSRPLPVSTNDMPDIAQRPHIDPQGTLDWVGMSDIHQPVLVRDGKETQRVQAQVQLYVDLADPLGIGGLSGPRAICTNAGKGWSPRLHSMVQVIAAFAGLLAATDLCDGGDNGIRGRLQRCGWIGSQFS